MASSRFPGKVMADINGKPMLERILDRLKKCNRVATFIVATPDQEIADFCKDKAVVYVGQPENVLERYMRAAYAHRIIMIVRVTADCPLIDSEVVDCVINGVNYKSDYTSNVINRTWPWGLDAEVIHYDVLARMNRIVKDKKYKEHVTLMCRERPDLFIQCSVELIHGNYTNYDWRVDWPDDMQQIRDIYKACGPYARWTDIIKYLGGKVEPVRVIARDECSTGGSKTAYGADAIRTSTTSDSPGTSWYERQPGVTPSDAQPTPGDLQTNATD